MGRCQVGTGYTGFGSTRADAMWLCVGLPLGGWGADAAMLVRNERGLSSGGCRVATLPRPKPAPETTRRSRLIQAAGVPDQTASNAVLLTCVLGACGVWTASYVKRVVTKDMSYTKQLDAYEEAVMQKRLEEMPSAELTAMLAEVEAETARLEERKARAKELGL